ncbi:MAG: hypothetical protein J3K34DRAFT_521945 [Monoraphidium minutum]|nr:MAG: hypothetical protein J3K34DRAFT_521945 [Monoraphidium minutum]
MAMRGSRRPAGLACLALFIALAYSGIADGRYLEPGAGAGVGDGALVSRPAARRLAAATELVRQCDWAPGDRCALGAEYASRALGAATSDPVAQYVSQSLVCARVTSAAACAVQPGCAWDRAFADGQEGCFLSEAQQLAVQQSCVAPRYARAVGALQACVAARRSCQCADAAACAAVTAGGACQPLLGCWLARLQGSAYDVMQLAEAHMLRVGPLLSTLAPNATAVGLAAAPAAGARRRLLQPTGLNQPVFDDPVKKKAAAGSPPPAAGAAQQVALQEAGQNQPILSDAAALSGGAQAGGGAGGLGKLESGSLLDAGIIQEETAAATATGAADALAPGDGDALSMTYAPPSFWKCLGEAAVTSDRARDWANIDYNVKKLTLETWLKVITKLSLLDWGIKVLECYKQQAAASKAGGVGAAPNSQSQESYEYAIVALIRAFSAMHDQFAEYMQAAPADKAARAAAGLEALTERLLPASVAALEAKYNSSAAYTGDALLQSRALLADALWFMREARAVGEADRQPVAAYEAVFAYSGEQMRHLLRWLFSEQFGGPRAYLPTQPPAVPAGVAAAQALAALAAVQLPAASAPLTSPRWLQARAMGTHAALAAALDAAALPTGAAANATLSTGGAVSAMGAAHIADFWGARIDAARAAADPALRALALDDRGGARGWRDAALGLAGALRGLRYQVAFLSGDDSAPAAPPAPAVMRDGMARLLAGVAMGVNPSLPDGAGAAAVDANARAEALAAATLGCYGAGGAAAARAAACTTLNAASAALVKAALGDLGANDVLYAAASEGASLQWRCAARPAASCAMLPGCVRALLPAAPTPGPYPMIAPLPFPGEVASCQADDGRLSLRRADNATKAALAAGPTCSAFLQLPVCEAVAGGAAACEAYAACRWQARGSRYFIQGPAAAPAKAGGAADGVCGADWPVVLQGLSGSQLRGVLAAAASTCASQALAGGCGALLVEVELPGGGGGRGGPPSAVLAAAVAVAAAAAVLLAAGGAYFVLRRRAAARAAASGASGAAAGGAPGSGGGDGGARKRKGASKKRVWKRKIKRAEPGEYKPDLMRDSFTDYLARPAFRAGVALAAANIAAGPQEFENPLASLRDEVGAQHRLLLEPTLAFISGARPLPRGSGGGGGGSDAGGEAEGAQPAVGALIDLGSGDGAADGGDEGLVSRRAGGQLPPLPPAAGSAVAAPQEDEPGELLQPRFSYNPFSADADAARLSFGASPSLARTSHHSTASAASVPAAGGSAGGARGSRLGRISTQRRGAAARASGAASVAGTEDEGEGSQGGTPTSSCCHDSVCTFRIAPPAPGSTAGSVASYAGSARGGGGVPASRARRGAAAAAAAAARVRERDLAAAREGDGEERSGPLSLSRTSWASQDLLVSVPSSAPLEPRR